jgi:hypothetical protein
MHVDEGVQLLFVDGVFWQLHCAVYSRRRAVRHLCVLACTAQVSCRLLSARYVAMRLAHRVLLPPHPLCRILSCLPAPLQCLCLLASSYRYIRSAAFYRVCLQDIKFAVLLPLSALYLAMSRSWLPITATSAAPHSIVPACRTSSLLFCCLYLPCTLQCLAHGFLLAHLLCRTSLLVGHQVCCARAPHTV